jgi:hypothetical protein
MGECVSHRIGSHQWKIFDGFMKNGVDTRSEVGQCNNIGWKREIYSLISSAFDNKNSRREKVINY